MNAAPTRPASESLPALPRPAAGRATARLPGLSLPVLLLGLVLAVLIPALGLGAAAAWQAAAGHRAAAEARLLDTARALALAMDREIAALTAALDAFVTSPTFGPDPASGLDLPTLHAQARRLSGQLGAPVMVAARDGTQLLSTLRPPGTPLPRGVSQDAFDRAFAEERPVVGNLVSGNLSGRPVFAVVVPVRDAGGRIALVAGAAPEAARLRDLLAAQGLPPDSFAAVTDARHVLVARSDAQHDRLVGQPVPPENVQRLSERPAGLYRAKALDGTERVFGFHALAAAPGWTVVVARDAAVLDEAWRGPLRALAGGGLLALLAGGILAFLVARAILRPVGRLQHHARALAAGDGATAAAAMPPAPVVELEQLRRGFAEAQAAIAAREAEAAVLLAASPVGVIRCDVGGRVATANDAFLRILGLTRATLAAGGIRWDELTPPEWLAGDARAIAEAMASPEGRCRPYEKEYLRPDGTRAPVLVTFALLDRAAGQAAAFVVDLTEVRRAEAAALESEARLRRVMDNLFAFVGLLAPDGTLLEANRAPLEAAGLSIEAVRGRKFWDCPWWTHDPAVQARVRDAVVAAAAGAAARFDVEVAVRDGGRLAIDFQIVPLRDAAGRITHLVPSAVDISDRVAAAAVLRASETRWRGLFQHMHEGFMLCEIVRDAAGAPADFRFLELNAAWERLTGLPPREAVGRLASEVVPGLEPHWLATYARVAETGEPAHVEHHAAALGRWFEVYAYRTEPDRFAALFLNVTARKAGEAALAESEARLRRAEHAGRLGSFEWDVVAGRATYSDGYVALHGLPPGTRTESFEDWRARIHPADRERTVAQVADLSPAGPGTLDYRIIHPDDGAVRWIAERREVFRDAAGQPIRVVGSQQDITDRRAAEQALAESEARLRLALEAGGLGTWAIDPTTGALTWDARMRAIMGVAADRAVDLAGVVRERVHPEDRDRVAASIAAALEPAGPGELLIEHRCLLPDGTVRWISGRGRAVFAGEGEARRAVSLLGTALDITDRVAAEAALAAAGDQLRQALEAAGLGAWSFDVQTGQVTWDARTRAIFGVGPEEPLDYDRVVWRLVHPDDRARVHAAACAAWDPAGTGEYTIEHRVVRPDGRLRWVSIRGSTSFAGAGEARVALRMSGTAADVTERVTAEAELAATEERLRLAVEAAELGVLAWDLRAGRLTLSERCRALYGLAPAAAPSFDLLLAQILPEDRAATETAIARAMQDRRDFDLEHRVRRPDGAAPWLRLRGRAELGPDGAVVGLLGVAIDIDAQKQAEAALRGDKERLEERVAERTRALTLAAAELRSEMHRREQAQAALLQAQKLEALGQLTGGVAHDFNNVLAAVMGSLRLIAKRAAGDARIQDLARNGEQAAERAAALVRQLLAFARREELAPAACDPAELLAGAQELARRAVGAGVRVAIETEPGLWPVMVDRHRLEVALLNLALNARDAMGGRGAITLGARNVPAGSGDRPPGLRDSVDCIVVSVCDTGPGMPPEVLARATEPFFTTKPRGKGTGLGLAMVHGFAHQSGGGLRILSAPGEGTTVEIWLLRAAGTPADAPHAGKADRALHGRATILVVDDDDAVRMVTAGELRDLGYQVIEANGAESGLVQALAAERLDLLVTDIVMPGGDGPSLAARLREARPGVPVLFITGFAEDRSRLAGEAILAKPFTTQDLADRVLGLLRRLPAQDRLYRRLRQPALREAYLAWRRLRTAGEGLPRPEACDLTGPDGPPEAFLVAVEEGGGPPAFRFLRVGAALTARLGRPIEGRVADAAVAAEEAFAGLAETYARCARFGVPSHDYARFSLGEPGGPLHFERLLLPFSVRGDHVPTHLLGIVSFEPPRQGRG